MVGNNLNKRKIKLTTCEKKVKRQFPGCKDGWYVSEVMNDIVKFFKNLKLHINSS